MNERIQELFHESIEDCDGTMKDRVYSLKQSEIEKFAELIVRECARVCAKIELDEELSTEADIWDGAMMCRVEIMEHFGVEE